MTSYEDIAATVRNAGRAAASGAAAVVEGELVGLQGVLTRATPPGWHPDPAGRARLRWWDGTRWTEHTAA
ncbi:MAG: DUF2510 domain-containing protein [Acidimicrobiia bacterium]|nr:DUF2510 domain-containing protein [Acidimicrobiia bacterium]